MAGVTANRLALILTAALTLAGCSETESGPLRIVAVGPPPAIVNPNLADITPGSALLLATVAQGLVRFDSAGEIEPALAESWIVSDDGRRYTFRLRRTTWPRGEDVTAQQVVDRLNAALSNASRNPLKPVLGAIDEIEAMTDRVLEIRLKAPRPHFLQLLAQPAMAILTDGEGSGPYRIETAEGDAVNLIPPAEEEEGAPRRILPDIRIVGAPAEAAIAGFRAGLADFVTGGTIGDSPLLAVANIDNNDMVFDPAAGLLGLTIATAQGPIGDPRLRQALSMAIDRDAIAQRFSLPGFQPRLSILPDGIDDQPAPVLPDWAAAPLPMRRETAADLAAEVRGARPPLRVRVALPPGGGYRILFAHLRRDWAAIGVEASAVAADAPAELRLIDMVAPAELASWYLRPFLCGVSPVCDANADEALAAARLAGTPDERRALFIQAETALTATTAFIPIASPVRWSLRSRRVMGFRPNPFALHLPTELIGEGG